MRSTLNDRHNFDKEIYNKFDHPRPGSSYKNRNPIVEEPEPSYYGSQYDYQPESRKKNRVLARGDFSEKNQGSFALQYDTYEDYKPGKKCYNIKSEDPIKPPEYIPPAQFKRPDRNPILGGEVKREPELRIRPDQVSNVFNNRKPEDRDSYERQNYLNEKNRSRVFDEYIPEQRSVKTSSYTQAGELLQYRYGPNYRDNEVAKKPSNIRYDKGEIKQYDDLKTFAEVMKEKRNSSNIFY